MNYNSATQNEYLILFSIRENICENTEGPKGQKFFRYRADFEQNKGVWAEFRTE